MIAHGRQQSHEAKFKLTLQGIDVCQKISSFIASGGLADAKNVQREPG